MAHEYIKPERIIASPKNIKNVIPQKIRINDKFPPFQKRGGGRGFYQ